MTAVGRRPAMEADASPASRPGSRRERLLLALTAALAIVCVALAATLAVVTAMRAELKQDAVTGDGSPRENVEGRALPAVETGQGPCVTPGCVTVAHRLLRYRQPAASPCQDFHEHACGGWLRQVRQLGLADGDKDYAANVDPRQGAVNWKLQHLLTSAKYESLPEFLTAQQLYKSCLRGTPGNDAEVHLSVEHVFSQLLGGFRSAANWSQQPVELTQVLVQLHQLLGAPLFELRQERDPYDRRRWAFVLTPPDIGPLRGTGWQRRALRAATPRTWRTLNRLSAARQRRPSASASASSSTDDDLPQQIDGSHLFLLQQNAASEDHIQNSMEFFKEYIHAGNHSSEFNSTDVDDMKNFLSSMAMITPSHREKVEMEIHGEQVYVNPMTVDDLESEYTFVNWTVLLSEALSANVSSSDIVYVPFPGYLDDLDMKIELLPAHTIHNGLLLMYRMDYLSAMADMLAPAPAAQLKDMCLDLTKDMYPVPVAGMFVRDAGRGRLQQLKDEVSVLLNDIKTVLTTSIERKAAAEPSPVYSMALRKLRSLRSLLVASPSFWSDEFIAQNTPPCPVWRGRV
ncbi:membrane metallo-endopeptidase-like 1 [Pollicipes pollicipes]|uniref:membrane metallo-endopeptidase-like 1 n=1 Tax=Pollicipes pollicipes TaxID=41117 RepID=UPI001885586C|nr:membrane metallo-endopeptidase-like 1 [Pollicipes pollicipes]